MACRPKSGWSLALLGSKFSGSTNGGGGGGILLLFTVEGTDLFVFKVVLSEHIFKLNEGCCMFMFEDTVV